MWLQKCLGIIVQVCKYILENCQKFYSSTPAIKCVKYLLPVLIFKSKTASQGGLSFFFSFHSMRKKFRGIRYNIGHNLKSVEKKR